MTDRGEKILIIFAATALLAVLCFKGKIGWQYHGKPAVADHAELQEKTDDMIVGDSGPVMGTPTARVQLANTRYVAGLPWMPAPLRQVTRGPMVTPQMVN